MAKVSELTPEERKRKLAEIEARRRANLGTYQTVTEARDDIKAATAPLQEAARLGIDKAIARSGVDAGAIGLLPGGQLLNPPRPAVLERISELAQKTGGLSTRHPTEELSRDIEGALRPGRGGVETVAEDQRLIVGPGENATGMATRMEYPSLVEHYQALPETSWLPFTHGKEGQASKMGVFGNVADAFPRAVATTLMYAKAADQGQPLKLEQMPADIGGAIANTGGATGKVGEGGRVATRGSGFGDWMRSHFQDVKEGRVQLKRDGKPIPFEEATGRDWFGVLAPALQGFWGGVWLPGKTMVKTASAAAENALSRLTNDVSDPDAPGASDVLDTIVGLPRDYGKEVRDLKAEFLDRKLSDVDINDTRFFDLLGTAMGVPMPVSPGLGKLAGVGLKGAEKLPVVGKAATLAREVATADLMKIASPESRMIRGLKEAEGLQAARNFAGDVTGAKRQAAAQSAVESGEQLKLITQGASKVEPKNVPLVKELLESPNPDIRLRARPDADVMGDIMQRARLSAGAGLSTADAGAVQRAIQGDTASLFNRRFHLAEALDIPIHEPHAWAAGTKAQQQALSAAVDFDRVWARELAVAQETGKLPSWLSREGRFAHPPRAPLPAKLAAKGWGRTATALETFADPLLKKPSYNPFARRTMSATDDVQKLRAGAADLLQSGTVVDQAQRKFLGDFIHDSKMQKPGVPPVGPPNREAVRSILETHGVRIEPPTNTVDEANKMAAARGSRFKSGLADAQFVDDPVRALLMHRGAVATEEMHARLVRNLKDIQTPRGGKLVEPLENYVLAPRRGGGLAPDMKTDILRYAKRGPQGEITTKSAVAALFDQNGDMLSSLKNKLKDDGMVLVGQHDAIAKFAPGIVNHVLPKVVYEDLAKTLPKLEPRLAGRAVDVILKMMSAWVPMYLNTPGFHIRNAFFGMFQVYLATSLKDMANFPRWRLAGEIASAAERGGLVTGTTKQGTRYADLVEEVRQQGVFEGGRIADLEGTWRRGVAPYKGQYGRQFLQGISPFNMNRGAFGLTKEPISKIVAGRGAGYAMSLGGGTATSENVQRVFIYLTERAKGKLPNEAAAQVIKFMFDYTGTNLSRFEKGLRKVFPFYQWLKQSGLMTVEQLLKQPDKYARVNRLYQLAHMAGQDKNVDLRGTPRRIMDTGAVASPFSEDTGGKRRYLKMERPGTQLSWTDDTLGQLHPGLQPGIELTTGEYLFGDMPISVGADPHTKPQDWYGRTIGNVFPKINKQDFFRYLGEKGGPPGWLANILLAQMDPETARVNPRHAGMDDTERLMNRLTGMFLGPTPMQVDAEDVRAGKLREVQEARKNAAAEQADLKKRQLVGPPLKGIRPLGFTDSETIP